MLGSASTRLRAGPARSAPSLTRDMTLKLRSEPSRARCERSARSLDARQHVELVERRRRRQGPFQRGRARAPWIIGRSLLAQEGVNKADEEDDQAEERDI